MSEHRFDDDQALPVALATLRDDLVEATARRGGSANPAPAPDRRSAMAERNRASSFRLVAAAAVALVIGIGIVGYTVGIGQDAAADVTVQRDGSSVTVSIDDDVTPEEIRSALVDDVDLTVVASPTGPSRINRFVGIAGPSSARLVGGDGTTSLAATFTKGSEVTLILGVAADGQPYATPTDATASGEPLAGLNIVGERVGDVRSEIDAAAATSGASVSYLGESGPTGEPAADARIVSAQAAAADRVTIAVR